MKLLNAKGIKVIVYELVQRELNFFSSPVINDLAAFKLPVDLIAANRKTEDLLDIADKVDMRDLFGSD